MARLRRTQTCGELRESHVGQTVVLNGWVNTFRAQNYQAFIDLRDRYGLTQVICDPERTPAAHAIASELRSEYVIQVVGRVVRRLPGTAPSLLTATRRCNRHSFLP